MFTLVLRFDGWQYQGAFVNRKALENALARIDAAGKDDPHGAVAFSDDYSQTVRFCPAELKQVFHADSERISELLAQTKIQELTNEIHVLERVQSVPKLTFAAQNLAIRVKQILDQHGVRGKA